MTPEAIVELLVGLLDAVVQVIGKDKVVELLTDDAIKRANAVADAVDTLKFPKAQ